MLKRYYITLGATTTAGGKVVSAGSIMSIDGGRVALDGDRVQCGCCHAEGHIALDGPRLPSSFNGRQYALSEDLCICKCDPPPRLVAAQRHAAQAIDTDWAVDAAAASPE